MSGFLEPPVGFEPTTRALQVRCSGQLSYGGLFSKAENRFAKIAVYRYLANLFFNFIKKLMQVEI